MKQYTRFLSLILCLVLCLSLLPSTALAGDNSVDFSDGEEETETLPDESIPEAEEDSTADENILADVSAGDSAEENPVESAEEIVIEIMPGDASADDNDELFAGYVDQVFSGNDDIMLMSEERAGDQLTGNNLIMYNTLKTQIENIASGKTNYTQLSVPLDSMIKKYEYTAAELGMESISADKNTAIAKALGCNMTTVVSALLADCPYELYWYAKTETLTFNAACAVTKTKLTFVKNTSITFNFCVTADYAQDPTADPSYYTDITKTSATSQAVANAQAVVNAAAGYTDYDKLVYYRNQICDLTSYNSDAAAATGSYGDPWQLIYVFDGDPDTNVVCEGYAKAFQYLCELTQFADSRIYSILAAGTIQMDGEDARDHMWNVVHMPDGKNYLVDVTNCDTGAIGAPDLLFLRGTDTGSVSEGYRITVKDTPLYATYAYSTAETTDVFPSSYLELSTLSSFNALNMDHSWSAWEMDDSTKIKTRVCTVCGTTDTCIPGDAYKDFQINLKDLLLLKEALSGIDVEIYTEGADVDRSGDVNLYDLLLLKQKLANA